jgi:hypothetical protein
MTKMVQLTPNVPICATIPKPIRDKINRFEALNFKRNFRWGKRSAFFLSLSMGVRISIYAEWISLSRFNVERIVEYLLSMMMETGVRMQLYSTHGRNSQEGILYLQKWDGSISCQFNIEAFD